MSRREDDARDVAFASGALKAFAHLSGIEPDQAYDRLLEASRHALLYLDTCLSVTARGRLRPLLDLLTALQLDAEWPDWKLEQSLSSAPRPLSGVGPTLYEHGASKRQAALDSLQVSAFSR